MSTSRLAERVAENHRRAEQSPDWSQNLKHSIESLDYEVIDNEPHRSGSFTEERVVARWVITFIIGALVGTFAFCIESAISVLFEYRSKFLQIAVVAGDSWLLGSLAGLLSHSVTGLPLAMVAAYVVVYYAPAGAFFFILFAF